MRHNSEIFIEDKDKSMEQELQNTHISVAKMLRGPQTVIEHTDKYFFDAIAKGDLGAVKIIVEKEEVKINFREAEFFSLVKRQYKIFDYLHFDKCPVPVLFSDLKNLAEVGLKDNDASLLKNIFCLVLDYIYRTYYKHGEIFDAQDFKDREKYVAHLFVEILIRGYMKTADGVYEVLVMLNDVKNSLPQYKKAPRLPVVLSMVLEELVKKGEHTYLIWLGHKYKLTDLAEKASDKIQFISIFNNTHKDPERCLNTLKTLIASGIDPKEKSRILFGQTLDAAFAKQFPQATAEVKELQNFINITQESPTSFLGFGKSSS